MRIALFQTDMHIGGIQRSLHTLLTGDAFSGFDVDLYLRDHDIDFSLDELPENVSVQFFPKFPYVCRIVPFDLLLRFARGLANGGVDPYDVAIDFNGYSQECAFHALTVPARKRVIWVHSDYKERRRNDRKFRLLLWAFKGKYKRFDKIVCVSRGVADSLLCVADCGDATIDIIPNLLDEKTIIRLSEEPINFETNANLTNMIYLGRFDRIKGIDGIIEAFDEAVNSGATSALYLMGQGPYLKHIEKMLNACSARDRIFILPAQSNPYPYVAKMDALILNSLYEGQGLVLREGQALDLSLIFPERLEKYNEGLKGVESIADAILHLEKREKKVTGCRLDEYNREIKTRLKRLLGVES